MQPQSLVQLIGSGNAATVEREWMRVVESDQVPVPRLAEYQVVLAELRRLGRTEQAEAMAWTAIETIASRSTPADMLRVASPFLLAIGESETLRKQVADMYRQAFPDREGIEALLDEAGLRSGRPVRRALRTLDVCLNLEEGDHLTARDDENVAARVVAIDRTAWEFTISLGNRQETLGAVLLADNYEPAAATDFRVLRRFAPDALVRRLEDEPADMVVELCRRQENKIDSDELQRILVPGVLSEAGWKKWWTRARTELKRHPNVTISGRSPYTITYDDVPTSPAEALLREFDTHREPHAQFSAVERYVRECRAARVEPSLETLRQCHAKLQARAQKLAEQRAAAAGWVRLAAARVGEWAGLTDTKDDAVQYLANAENLSKLFAQLESDSLLDLALECLPEARPADWKDILLNLLPAMPMSSSARIAARLTEAGCTAKDFAPVVEKIMAAPMDHLEALLWLWDAPPTGPGEPIATSIGVLTRILRTLEDSRRSDSVPNETVKTFSGRARTVLAARRYERFRQCLEELEPGMGHALSTQITRSETLGRSVREDFLKLIRQRFPAAEPERPVEPWTREDVIFVTQTGLARKQEEIEHHVNVKMKENSRAIGRAAEHGDLSENSEYKFALEERDLLRARLAQMNAEVAKAKVITAADVPTDHVGIGTRVVLERIPDGARYEMTFLDPWEADVDKGIFNYLAPLAQRVLGKRIGDEIEFEHSGATGTYRVVELANALQERHF